MKQIKELLKGHEQMYSEDDTDPSWGADGSIVKHLGPTVVSLQDSDYQHSTKQTYRAQVQSSTLKILSGMSRYQELKVSYTNIFWRPRTRVPYDLIH